MLKFKPTIRASVPSSRAHCKTVDIDKNASQVPSLLRNPICNIGNNLSSTNLLSRLKSCFSKILDDTGEIDIGQYSEADEDELKLLGNAAIFPVLHTDGKLASLTNLQKIVVILGAIKLAVFFFLNGKYPIRVNTTMNIKIQK